MLEVITEHQKKLFHAIENLTEHRQKKSHKKKRTVPSREGRGVGCVCFAMKRKSDERLIFC
jgi:hypothetical protein